MNLSYKHRQLQPASDSFALVVGAELACVLHSMAGIVFIHIYQVFGYHQWDDVHLSAEPVDSHIHHIKSFSEHFVAEGKSGSNLAYHAYLVVYCFI